MWLFWIVAGALAAATAALVVARAVAAAKVAAGGVEDPTLPVYRRQLAEIDDLAARGLLGEADRRAAHAEAGRRLLAAAERPGPPESAGGRGPRLIVLGGVGVAVLAALALYGVLGSPGDPDQPYRARVAAWRANPNQLRPPEMAAVLRLLTSERPKDPQALAFLGQAEMAAGDPIAAATAFRKAIALTPARAELQMMLGEALLTAAGEGQPAPDADAAFRKALALDPTNVLARYFLARAQITHGDRAAGEAAWKALLADIPANDPRRLALETDMAQATGKPAPAARSAGATQLAAADAAAAAAAASGTGPAALGGAEQAGFIRAMVARLAARLAASPDDPDGWARLVRAYGVLGDKPAQAQALDKARKQFAGRPADLAKVEAEAHAP
ncbi:MAG TPA: c-type cytochrome biogenesis protein CcmI [Caulobacteraceae bacterium]|jgi:cytochrome c-type biogenesis protein CcmH|nr:c-type cytochrome biogenesis protein CcmI [Caulobacteraceae bacterium]